MNVDLRDMDGEGERWSSGIVGRVLAKGDTSGGNESGQRENLGISPCE